MYPFWKTDYWNINLKMTNKLANRQVHRITLIHFTAAGGEQGNRKGGKREKKKSRHPAEERPNYKSLNCNQKGDVPSATASVLFHCSFSRWQLVPPQNKTARWWRNVASKQGVCMETFMRMSRCPLAFHEPWHPKLDTAYTSCLWARALKTDAMKE